jgi:hypothetical protein
MIEVSEQAIMWIGGGWMATAAVTYLIGYLQGGKFVLKKIEEK